MLLPKFWSTSTVSSTLTRTAVVAAVMAASPGVAHCDEGEPVFTHLEIGEAATFPGYLLSPEAVGSVVTVDDERRLKELAAQKLVFDEEKAGFTRDIKLKDARIERLEGEAQVVADARAKETAAYKQEISRLKRRTIIVAIVSALCGGAVAGAAALL